MRQVQPHGWAGFNVTVAADTLHESAALTTQVQGQLIPSDVPDSLAMGVRAPCGVVVGIAPWNAPSSWAPALSPLH